MIRAHEEHPLPAAKVVAHIAMGSNVGDSAALLLAAAKALDAAEGIEVRRMSQMVQTAPAGGPPGQRDYLNAAIEVETTLQPHDLLAALHAIEKSLGRDREHEQRWGPRTCDLDIVLMGELVLATPQLQIPHPRMHERAFVLRPLAQIAPGALHPVLHKTVVELLEALTP